VLLSQSDLDLNLICFLQISQIDDQKTFTAKSVLSPKPIELTIANKKDAEKERLRKRHEPVKKKNSEWVQITEDISSLSDDKDDIELDEKKNKKKIKKGGDPLYWFGLFVSPSLRNSQDHFKSGITFFWAYFPLQVAANFKLFYHFFSY
jgi:hypothetical protein